MNPWPNRLAIGSLLTLLFLCLAWELWLAPLRAGGSTLALKGIPLLFPLFGLLRGTRYTHQWTSLLALPYIAEGAVRAVLDTKLSQALAFAEIALALALFGSCLAYARISAPSRTRQS
ncbi:MAG: DUF2069 domain-containing protein [Betaproteobacteria bacterium HGW-Betaproteobacteria-11]|nr:MAG: DUF2069 domain-containing protein [Betaproteobacteria bacterium HGW-Betaproteobacteria-11]